MQESIINNSDIDAWLMQEALKEARKAFYENEVPIGAVISLNNQIIARAYNMTERLKDATAHAEIQAITSASNFLKSKYLTECTIYTTLEPCIMCAGALFWSKIRRIVFAAPDPLNGFMANALKCFNSNKPLIVPNILSNESKNLIDRFFKNKRSKSYL